MKISTPTINWLLNSDPSITWQVKKDLLDLPSISYSADRAKIEHEGWGKELLSYQSENGTWNNNLYSPKWISTTYSLLVLVRFGLNPDHERSIKGCIEFLNQGLYKDGGINYWKSMKQSEQCVTGLTLFLCSYFSVNDERIHSLVNYLLETHMDDGGWNCLHYRGHKHSSFHTTINVLEGLAMYNAKYNKYKNDIEKAQQKAHELLLQHKLYKSDKTGKVIKDDFKRLAFPPRWHYDILRILDYFQQYNLETDDRINDALDLIHQKQADNGHWKLEQIHKAKEYFPIEQRGKESKWNTLRCLRVIKKLEKRE